MKKNSYGIKLKIKIFFFIQPIIIYTSDILHTENFSFNYLLF